MVLFNDFNSDFNSRFSSLRKAYKVPGSHVAHVFRIYAQRMNQKEGLCWKNMLLERTSYRIVPSAN
jgi:hypothetical protein